YPRQCHPHRRALAGLAVDGDRAVVGPDDGLRNRETEPDAARPPAAGLLAAIKPVEDSRQLLGAHPAAGIADREGRQFLVSSFWFLVMCSFVSSSGSLY